LKEFTLEWNLMHVNNVEKPPICTVAVENLNKLMVVRNPMYISSEEKFLFLPGTTKHMN
jgi:hypothetical protein